MDDAREERMEEQADAGEDAVGPEQDAETSGGEAVAEPRAETGTLPETTEELRAEVERLREAWEEEHDRHLRAVAELQNFRRRVAREQQERARYAGEDVLARILPVMDNLQRVLEHEADAGSEEFARGVRLVVEEFFRVLRGLGVTVIDCQGEPFDPAMHEAVAQVEMAGVPEGTIVAVDAPGYCLHDRCLRPARVVVAKEPEGAERGA
ncbi:MAG: nucleotide exchange factor GrpE [Armatimonadota bacterium]